MIERVLIKLLICVVVIVCDYFAMFLKKGVLLFKGQNEFEDLRRLVKQGGDFCKDLATVLQER